MKKWSIKSSKTDKYRRAFRDMGKMTILNSSEKMSDRMIQRNIEHVQKNVHDLDIYLSNVDNKVIKKEATEFTERIAYLTAEQDRIDVEIESYRTKNDHLRSQISRVDLELEKYSTNDDRFNADHKINVLENHLLLNNQKTNMLKLKGMHFQDVVNELLLLRRRFQISHDNIIAKLMVKKREILELVDHYSIGFANGMKNWRGIDACRVKSAETLKQQLQEMRHLIRTAETNDVLMEFMIGKGTHIELSDDCVLRREILIKNYTELIKMCEDQLNQIKAYAPELIPSDLEHKRRQTFSLYLFENELVKNIEDIERSISVIKEQIAIARANVRELRNKRDHLDELNINILDGAEKIDEENERYTKLDVLLKKYMDKVYKIYEKLKCETVFGFERSKKVDISNINEVLKIIEVRIRQTMYAVYCREKESYVDEDRAVVHDIEFVRPVEIPEIDFINPCPECSYIEARVDPDFETIIDSIGKFNQLKEEIKNRTRKAQTHSIDNCTKPGSKAVLSKNI